MKLNYGITVREAGPGAVTKALQETARAYFHANPFIQYNTGYTLTDIAGEDPDAPEEPVMINGGGWSPEDAAEDTPYYGVCRSFTADIYYDAFHVKVPGFSATGFQTGMKAYPEAMAFRFGHQHDDFVTPGAYTTEDKDEFIRTLRRDLKPGDTILGNPEGKVGHVIMFLGDVFGNGTDYVIHCWPVGGGKFNPETGKIKREPVGAATVQTADEFLFSTDSTPNWALTAERMKDIYVLRFADMKGFPDERLTDAAVTRVNCPGLIVKKECSVLSYGTVLPGETVRVTERFLNKSNEAYEFDVTEYVPEGAETAGLSEGLTQKGNALSGRIRLEPFGTARISYELKITTEPGALLRFPNGKAGGIRTRAHSIRVAARRFTAEENEKWAGLASSFPDAWKTGFEDLAFAKRVYRAFFGRDIALPDTADAVLKLLYDVKKPAEVSPEMLLPKTELTPEGETVDRLGVPRFTEGRRYFRPDDRFRSDDRAFDLSESCFLPGDVMIALTGENRTDAKDPEGIAVYFYLGKGQVLSHRASGTEVLPYSETFQKAILYHFARVFRPNYL